MFLMHEVSMKKVILSLILVLILNHTAFALKSDQNKSMILMADKIKFDNKLGEGHYIGNVYLKQGSSLLKSDTAWTYINKKNSLKKAIALGNNLKQAFFRTLIEGKKEYFKGHANKITYLPQKQLIYLEGRASLAQGKNKYEAPIIIYDIEKQRLVSKKTTKHRSTIHIENDKTA